ncbi:hypothetical protein [Christiangramia crocea]|uniref:Uncharacterized protein n=1 Tax=Christiangramia crocea TaxID=2904124 RepID=A0A9X1V0G6_9FLAO|nr:hypothetical protein [Gramella crocea]MCG9972583.1 hypothetical protein [Gramella crocea]
METLNIPKRTTTKDEQDFNYLRKVGLDHITAMSRKLWTDYNLHDPGITILEVLCYAITDLGYRINMPVSDLVDLQSREVLDKFPSAKEVLTTKSITENDYRKLFIDIEGVKNAFIRPYKDRKIYMHCSLMDEATESNPRGKLSYEEDLLPDYENRKEFTLKGLNQIYYELDTDIRELDEEDPNRIEKVNEIENEIYRTYHSNRNLCEDLIEVTEVKSFEFQVCGDIEIDKTANALNIVVEVLFRIQEYVSPSVKRYTLLDLIEEGLSSDEIFNGPVLKNGFITDAELKKANFRNEVRLSDLIKIISETPGISRIRKLSMNSCPCNDQEESSDDCAPLENEWKICFPKDFDKVIDICLENSTLNIFKDVIPINIDKAEVKNRFRQKFREYNRSLRVAYEDLAYPQGNFRNEADYFSIQNDLPALYGVGNKGLSPSFPEERHAKKLQLKSYLTIFDQVLATYFAHLKNVGQLLSADLDGNRTYFSEVLNDIKDLEKIIPDSENFNQNTGLFLSEIDDFVGRKNEILDHLLARFAENMNDYVFLMTDLFGLENKETALWQKSRLIKEYPSLGYNRGTAFNHFGEEHGVWDTLNVSGLENRINRLLGIRDSSRRDLTKYYHEIFSDSGKWKWRIFSKNGEALFTGTGEFESEWEAETALWKAVSLSWNKENFQLFPAAGDNWGFNLIDHSFEIIAIHPETYDDKTLASEAIEEYAGFIFDKVTDEGAYVFENILFHPDKKDPEAEKKFMEICVDEDCMQCKPEDPYSFRLTFVLPGWTRRFSNMFFREFAERTIRAEVPAHILTRICWIGSDPKDENIEPEEKNPMEDLQTLYKKWLQKKMSSPKDQKDNEFLKPLVDMLHSLETIYPQGNLHDCNKDGDSSHSIILNKSSLGELKNNDNGSE